MATIALVVGARPNFMKVARLPAALRALELVPQVIHTGQHSSFAMAGVFFDQLGLRPDVHLETKAERPAEQIGQIVVALTQHLRSTSTDAVVVVGDVNSTLAAAIAANKTGHPLYHLEAGLRSFDLRMPEERNRRAVDALADVLLTTEASADANLLEEGYPAAAIQRVGNAMIDCLVHMQPKIESSTALDEHDLTPRSYALLTAHRPETVDRLEDLERFLTVVEQLTALVPVVFPVHPRTTDRLERHGLAQRLAGVPRLQLLEPLDYIRFQALVRSAQLVVTDSGGLQEETTYYGVPCLTIRENTERPSTLDVGTNTVVGLCAETVGREAERILRGDYKQGDRPELWDGNTSVRVAAHILAQL